MSTPAEVASRLAVRLRAALRDPEVRLAQAGLAERIAFLAGGISVGLVPGESAWSVLEPAPADCSVVLEADADVWDRALDAAPPPGFHSVTALRRSGHLAVAGDPLAFARALHLLERVLELVRAPSGPTPVQPARTGVERDLGQIEGRYHRVSTGAETATLYAERAGAGIPVLMLHTAGADSRQYQALLADVGLAHRWRMHAFDLPMHGRSAPPDGWDGGRWVLTQALYLGWCAAFLEQVVRAPAVIVGCSMGAGMALVLAAERPHLVEAVVALEAPFRARGRRSSYLTHAAVNASAHNPSYVRGLMSPAAAGSARRAATWIYGQGALGVYEGDLAFYEEFDGASVAPRIDGARCPVTFFTGAYDYSAPPAEAERLAALIPGSTVDVMPGLGHFPMIEDPDRLLAHLTPVLDRLAGRLGRGTP